MEPGSGCAAGCCCSPAERPDEEGAENPKTGLGAESGLARRLELANGPAPAEASDPETEEPSTCEPWCAWPPEGCWPGVKPGDAAVCPELKMDLMLGVAALGKGLVELPGGVI